MKSVAIHGILALFGLSFAYQTWTRPAEEERPAAADQPTLLECEEQQLTLLEVETATHRAAIRPKKASPKNEYWITSQRKPPEEEKKEEKKPEDAAEANNSEAKTDGAADAKDGAKAADAAKDANAKADAGKPGDAQAADATPAKKEARPYDPDAPVVFLANAKFHELLDGMTPLRALRSLGPMAKDKEAAFGFDKVMTHLRMECGAKKIALEIGGRTYGTGDRYAREPKGKELYLLDGKMITDLQAAQFKFMQTELHDFTHADVDEAVVSALGKERRLVHRNRQIKEQALWVDAAEPGKRNELFGNWFNRVARLKGKAYLGEGQDPGADLAIPATSVQPIVTIEYKVDGKPKDKMELVRVDTEQGGFYYARSGTTKRWVTVYDSVGKQVEEDVPMIVGAEEMPAASGDESGSEGASEASQPEPAAHGEAADPHAGFVHP